MNDFDDDDNHKTPVDVDTLVEALSAVGPVDEELEYMAFEPDPTPVNLVCAHCGWSPLVLVKDTTEPPRTAEEAWKNIHCLSTRDRTIWSFCRRDGYLRLHRDGVSTCFDRRRQIRD
jgi:hypothetical protein